MSKAMEYLELLQRSAYSNLFDEEWLMRRNEHMVTFLTDPNRPARQRARELARQQLKAAGLSEADIEKRLVRSGEPHERLDALPYAPSRYSKHESPIFASTIDQARRIAEEATQVILKKLAEKNPGKGHPNFESIAFGSLPNTSMNACAIRVPGESEYVIAINDGLPNFLARIARVIVRLITINSSREPEPFRLDDPDSEKKYFAGLMEVLASSDSQYVVENFVAAVGEYLGVNTGAVYNHIELNGMDRIFSETMTVGSEVFVIAHEINHIVDGHLIEWRTIANGLAGVESIEVGAWSHSMEMAADVAGLSTVFVAAARGIGNSPGMDGGFYEAWLQKGPQHFLFCAMVVEFLLEQANGAQRISETHPPTNERQRFLLNTIGRRSESFQYGYQQYLMIVKALMYVASDRIVQAIKASQ